jgi:hypothetical protein
MEMRRASLWTQVNLLVVIWLSLLKPMTAVCQAVPLSPKIEEVWQGLVLNSDFRRNYSISFSALAELASPHPFRTSEYFAGLRISRSVGADFRVGVECLQDRSYLGNSSLFLENRCAVDVTKKWIFSPHTRIYLRPKVEFRSYTGTFDQRLKIETELLHDVHSLRGMFRGHIEPAIDQQFHGFEKATLHTGMLWPLGKRVKVEVFNSVSVAKRPDYGIEAVGTIVFIQLQNKESMGTEVIR